MVEPTEALFSFAPCDRFEVDPNRAERTAAFLSRVLSLAALLLIATTWPLWTAQTEFPRIPFVGIFRGVPGWLERAALGVACCALVLALVAGSSRRMGRWSLVAFAGAITFLALADQHRLQPWAYQFLLLALVLAVLPAGEGIAWARLLTASIYFYSALSKLDHTFLESAGGQIVAGLLTFLHAGDQLSEFSQRFWPALWRWASSWSQLACAGDARGGPPSWRPSSCTHCS